METEHRILGFICHNGGVLLGRRDGRLTGITGWVLPYQTAAEALNYFCQVKVGIVPVRARQIARVIENDPATSRKVTTEVFRIDAYQGDPYLCGGFRTLDWYALSSLPIGELSPVNAKLVALTLVPGFRRLLVFHQDNQGPVLHSIFSLSCPA